MLIIRYVNISLNFLLVTNFYIFAEFLVPLTLTGPKLDLNMRWSRPLRGSASILRYISRWTKKSTSFGNFFINLNVIFFVIFSILYYFIYNKLSWKLPPLTRMGRGHLLRPSMYQTGWLRLMLSPRRFFECWW
jgi:hypothetical protein